MFNFFKTLWNKKKKLGFFLTISALSHLLIFVGLFLMNSNSNKPLRYVNLINVNIVSISKVDIKSKTLVNTKKTSEKPVSVKKSKVKKKTVKLPLKKNITKNIKKPKPNNKKKGNTEEDLTKVANAIEKIKKTVTKNNLTNLISNNKSRELKNSFASQKNGRFESMISNIVKAYQAEVAWRIEQNWFFHEQMIEEKKNIKAVLLIEIMKNGEIKDISFEKKSGISYLDESAYKAVLKANPFPPFPEAFGISVYKLGLTFTPSGIE